MLLHTRVGLLFKYNASSKTEYIRNAVLVPGTDVGCLAHLHCLVLTEILRLFLDDIEFIPFREDPTRSLFECR